jgi:hypothetical protein
MMTAIILGLLALSVLSLLAALTFLYRWIVRSRIFPQLPKLWKSDRQRFVISAAAFVVFMVAFVAVGMLGGGGPDSGDPTTPADQRPTGPSFEQPSSPSPNAQQPESAEQPQAEQPQEPEPAKSGEQSQQAEQPSQTAGAPALREPALPDPDADTTPTAPPKADSPAAAQEPTAPNKRGAVQSEALTGTFSAGPKEAAPAPEAPAPDQAQAASEAAPPAPEPPKAEFKPKPKPKAKAQAQKQTAKLPDLPAGKVYGVSVASFRKRPPAVQKAKELQKQGYTARVIPAKVKGKQWYRVCVGTFREFSKAKAQAERIRKKTKYTSAFATRIK